MYRLVLIVLIIVCGGCQSTQIKVAYHHDDVSVEAVIR